ncbi:MAG: sel1 repeat family protein [Clostridia bacterium]|nr:sel1 repeat family protein [Clostridia bacterium]
MKLNECAEFIKAEIDKATALLKSGKQLQCKKAFGILHNIAQINKEEFSKNTKAVVDYADCFYNGKGVAQNLEKAFEWYAIAAEKNFAVALRKRGICYFYGKGCEKNYDLATADFTQAVDEGDILANLYLAVCFDYGMGVKQDYEEALKYYQAAAKKGYITAKRRLGDYYLKGIASEINEEKAIELYHECIAHGDPEAMLRLANCYYEGQGVTKNSIKGSCYDLRASGEKKLPMATKI